jgi:hypothetical protein
LGQEEPFPNAKRTLIHSEPRPRERRRENRGRELAPLARCIALLWVDHFCIAAVRAHPERRRTGLALLWAAERSALRYGPSHEPWHLGSHHHPSADLDAERRVGEVLIMGCKVTLREPQPDDPIYREGLRMYSVRLGKIPLPDPEKSPEAVRKIRRKPPREQRRVSMMGRMV